MSQRTTTQWEVFRVSCGTNTYQRLPAVFDGDTERDAIDHAMKDFPGGGVYVAFRRAAQSFAVDMPDTTMPLRIQEIVR